MITRLARLRALVCGATLVFSLTLATAQPYIYPNQGQSPQQEQVDQVVPSNRAGSRPSGT